MSDTNLELMAHLMRRAGFGASRDELERRIATGYEATVEEPTEVVVLHAVIAMSPEERRDAADRGGLAAINSRFRNEAHHSKHPTDPGRIERGEHGRARVDNAHARH